MNKRYRLVTAVIVILAIIALDYYVDYEHMSLYIQISSVLTALSAIAGYLAGRDKNTNARNHTETDR